jgi:glycosyltransferase involved in cell wall biosynthesis
MISVLVLTLNEEKNIARCLSSLKWSDDVHVLDSFSSDKTVEIAKAAGATVTQRAFDNWAAHQNWAIANIKFRYRWVYYSDADEVIPADLAAEMLEVVNDSGHAHVAFRVRYKNYFMNRWIRHCGIYPVWVMRLFQPDKVRWERTVNPTAHVDGSTGQLVSHFHHFSFQKGMDAWFAKHNSYSSAEAWETVKHMRGGGSAISLALVSADAPIRRQALKELSYRLPCRPLLRFFYMYLFRLGFMDGAPGFHYCVLLSFYEYMITTKVREIRSDLVDREQP